MKVHYSFDSLKEIQNPVVTTGTFDGVHIGHRKIISRLNKLASDINGESVLITFHPHPRIVLYPDTKGRDLFLINTQEEKKMLLQETGLDHLVIIHFTKEFSKISSSDFIENFLINKLRSRIIVVGFNHHFGHNREGDYSYLYNMRHKYGFKVEEIPEQDVENESVSSTRIRKALIEGRIQRANAYLEHYFVLNAKTIYDPVSTEKWDYRMYRLKPEEPIKLIPPAGVYAVSTLINDTIEKGLIHIKQNKNSSSSSEFPDLELSLLQNEIILRNEIYTFNFHKRIRAGIGVENSRNQIRKDIGRIEDLIY